MYIRRVMKNKNGILISYPTIRDIIDRNELTELKKLYRDVCIGTISQHNREWFFMNYLNLLDKLGNNNEKNATCRQWAISGQIIDSILTHPEYRNRMKKSRCIIQQLEEIN